MGSSMPAVAKRITRMVRIVYFMLRMGIAKSKIMTDLHKMMKRGKIAGKAIGNLMYHQHHQDCGSSSAHALCPTDYEFNCSNSPANSTFRFPGFNVGRRNQGHFFPCVHPPETHDDDILTDNTVTAVLEILNNEVGVEASPAPPGRSPMVRQPRITDSPFPLPNTEEGSHVDEEAEVFISKFYNQLKRQSGGE